MTNPLWQSDYDVAHRASTNSQQVSVISQSNRLTGKLFSLPQNLQVLEWRLDGIGERNEFYVRENDLVERYRDQDAQLDTEVYVRLFPEDQITDLVISRQTERLDSQPGLQLVLKFSGANSVSVLNDQGAWNPPGLNSENIAELSTNQAVSIGCLDANQYGLFVYPGDCERLLVERTNEETIVVKVKLFAASLEKGVIRRSRLRLAQVDGKERMSKLLQQYQQFCQSEVPLTT